jgi:PAS domain S-box-containing protein
MNSKTSHESRASELRMQAVARIAERNGRSAATADPFVGLRALYDLASNPDTAERALAMLHELQVHQIELDLQDEELRRSRAEVEAELQRQQQLFDHLPVACLIIDGGTLVASANRVAADLFGLGREALLGKRLEGLLAPESGRQLLALLAAPDRELACAPLVLARESAGGVPVHVTPRLSRDPDGQHFLVALLEA